MLFNLLSGSRPEEATPETSEILKDISDRCDPCQRRRTGPTRFQVSFGSTEALLNERMIIYIMHIDQSPVYHIVDEGTQFAASRFLDIIDVEAIWREIIQCWASIYTGMHNYMRLDQATQLGKIMAFVTIETRCNVQVDATGTELHSRLGLGERYHAPQRNTFRKLHHEHPNAPKELHLQFL